MSTYRLVLLLFGGVVGQLQGVCFRSIIDLDLMSCMIHSPSFGAWYVHLMSGYFRDNVRPDFHRPMKIGKNLCGHLTPRPNLHVNRTCRVDLVVSMCVDVRWSAFVLGFWSMFCALLPWYDMGETIYLFMHVLCLVGFYMGEKTGLLSYFMSKSDLCFGTRKKMGRPVIPCLFLICVSVWGKKVVS